MAEVRLANLRIGFDYSADVVFPPGFLAAGESIRGKLRRYPGGEVQAIFTDERAGDIVTWSLLGPATSDISPGDYISEAIIYNTEDPGVAETPLADNVFILTADYSPSE